MAGEKIRAEEIMSDDELDKVVGGVSFNIENFIINAKIAERGEIISRKFGEPKKFPTESESTKNWR